jgi:hypothetical protein
MNNAKSLIKTLTQIAMAVLLVMAIPAAQAAKGGGGKVSVTAASPGEALQGEELVVTVSGSGFDEGTTTKYLVTGTNDEDQITVISTEFVDANQLKTRIRVKDGATVIDYDIQATNSRGRRGKGTTLFSVKQTGGGKPPPPPPVDCTDEFPGFIYHVEATRKSPAEVRLASTDGCRTEPLIGGDILHMTENRKKGVLLWRERTGDLHQDNVYRQDFTIADNGDLVLGVSFKILPLEGEEVAVEDEVYLDGMDIWGDATHESLYLVTFRMHAITTGERKNIRELLIYNLNDMSDVRSFYLNIHVIDQQNVYENCPPNAIYPQFVPACYKLEGISFNPSGTRLYIPGTLKDNQGQRWDGVHRIEIDHPLDPATGLELPLDMWEFYDPELIYTGSDGPSGTLARPDADPYTLPFPEHIVVSKFADTGQIVDADLCAAYYAPFNGGMSDAHFTSVLWEQECIVTSTFFSPNIHGGGDSWQSPNALLTSIFGRRQYDIYRQYIDGLMVDTEELLIENGRGADTGN